MDQIQMTIEHHISWRRDADARYYDIYLSQDLLGHWALTRAWGGQTSRLGRCMTDGYLSLQDALERLIDESRRRKQHRYRRVS